MGVGDETGAVRQCGLQCHHLGGRQQQTESAGAHLLSPAPPGDTQHVLVSHLVVVSHVSFSLSISINHQQNPHCDSTPLPPLPLIYCGGISWECLSVHSIFCLSLPLLSMLFFICPPIHYMHALPPFPALSLIEPFCPTNPPPP